MARALTTETADPFAVLPVTAHKLRHGRPEARAAFMSWIKKRPSRLVTLQRTWSFMARPEQLPPTDLAWLCWFINAGRGFGKTRAGAETVRGWVKQGVRSIALIGQDAEDVRKVMVNGPSGLLSTCYPEDRTITGEWLGRPVYNPSLKTVTWQNGAVANLYSGEDPDDLRGPQHEKAWVDELAKMRKAEEVLDQLLFGLRLGANPQYVVTTTPRPTKVIRNLMAESDTRVVSGSTFENANNLNRKFLKALKRKYEGTRLGRQELYAEMLDDVEGAMWTSEMLERDRVRVIPELQRVVISVDPSGAKNEKSKSDEIGIIAAGLGVDGRGYVLQDFTITGGPSVWARRTIHAYHLWKAARVVAEKNYGGALVEAVLRAEDPNVSYKEVWATQGKAVRAEPIAALYEQGRVSHVGVHADLEQQLVAFTPSGYVGGSSPDRADALVWALTELMLEQDPDFELF